MLISCSHWGMFKPTMHSVLEEAIPFIESKISMEQFKDTGWHRRVMAVLSSDCD